MRVVSNYVRTHFPFWWVPPPRPCAALSASTPLAAAHRARGCFCNLTGRSALLLGLQEPHRGARPHLLDDAGPRRVPHRARRHHHAAHQAGPLCLLREGPQGVWLVGCCRAGRWPGRLPAAQPCCTGLAGWLAQWVWLRGGSGSVGAGRGGWEPPVPAGGRADDQSQPGSVSPPDPPAAARALLLALRRRITNKDYGCFNPLRDVTAAPYYGGLWQVRAGRAELAPGSCFGGRLAERVSRPVPPPLTTPHLAAPIRHRWPRTPT
jgi:hypothetical protein